MLISLARLSLWREWHRFLPAIVAVGFSGLLILAQLALLLGIFRTVSVDIDESSADLWVGFPDTPSVDLARNISIRNEVLLRQHSEIREVEQLSINSADIRRKDGTAATGVLIGIETRKHAMAFSKILAPSVRAKLDEPDSILIDVSAQANLQTASGEYLEINRRRVKVVAIVAGLAAIGGPNIICSTRTSRFLDDTQQGENETTFLLAGLRDPMRADVLIAELAPEGGPRPFSAWKADDLSRQSRQYWLLETGMGIGFIFSGLIATAIGLVVTSQTMKATVLSSLREYATLRALGVSFSQLRRVVLEQAVWVGLSGVVVTSTVTYAAIEIAKANKVLISAPPEAYFGTAVFIMVIALVSGWFAVNVLKKTDPATLLR